MKDIKHYEGLYAVTTDGQVWSYRKKRFMYQATDKDGYKVLALVGHDGKQKAHKVHRLVALTYIDNPSNFPCVNHKDESKDNNCVSNLEWCTHTYNMRYGTVNERRSNKLKSLNRGKAVYCVELDKVFKSVKEAIEATGATGISECCKGKYKYSGGYHWRYANGE